MERGVKLTEYELVYCLKEVIEDLEKDNVIWYILVVKIIIDFVSEKDLNILSLEYNCSAWYDWLNRAKLELIKWDFG